MTDKDAYRLFWMVKGHINASHSTIMACAPSYFARLWGNHEAYYREDGFEGEYNKRKIDE